MINNIATYTINYIYKYDDNAYWSVTYYRDGLGFVVPIYAKQYTYGVR